METTSKPLNGGKASVVLLSGFLGAGKTTLLKRILGWEADLSGTAVMVNEFGEVGIDGALLKEASGSEVVELTSGCICCTLSADLKTAVDNLMDRYRPHRILIESSGVADPTAIVQVLSETDLKHRVTIDKIITVLDADFWEARENFGKLFYNQLEMAHLILLNKVDLIPQEQIPTFLREIHQQIPGCQVVPTVQCRIDPETLWTPPAPKVFGLQPMEFYQARTQRTSVDASSYVTFSFQTPKAMDEDRFRRFIAELPVAVFRLKGPVRFPDRTEMLNFVGGRGNWSPWQAGAATQLAFIGWQVDSGPVLAQLERCIVS